MVARRPQDRDKGDNNRTHLQSLLKLAVSRMPVDVHITINPTEAAILDVLCEEDELQALTIAAQLEIVSTKTVAGSLRSMRDRNLVTSSNQDGSLRWTITDKGRKAAICPQNWAWMKVGEK